MTFLLSNWKYVIMGVLIASNVLFYNLWQAKITEFNLFEAKIEVLDQEAERKAKEIESHHAKVLEETKHAFETNLPKVRQDAVDAYKRRYSGNGLRLNAGSSQMPGTPGGPKGVDAASKEPVVNFCDEPFIRDSAEDAHRVMLWIDWANKNNLPVR